MAGVCSSIPVKFAMNPLKMVSIADPLTRLGWIQAHGLQVSDTKIFDGMEDGPKLVVYKLLCQTDISRRLVLPKNEAEANIPSLAANEARPIHMYDHLTARFWEFLHRCWENPNGKVRSYYIEKTDNQVQESSCSNLQLPVQGTISFTNRGCKLGQETKYSEIFPMLLVGQIQELCDLYGSPPFFSLHHFKRTSDPRFVSSSKLNRSFQQAMEPIPSQDEPTTSPECSFCLNRSKMQ